MPNPISNPPNPWQSTHVEWLGEPPPARLEVYEEEARSVLSENQSPDVPLRYSVNPYRGCFHGCAYCYARPTHEYLDFGAGTDFERRLIVKTNAPEVFARELASPEMRGEVVVFSGNTDCYQPLEASYELTRRCLEVALQRRQSLAIITKSVLVQRDAELLARIARVADLRVFLSIPFHEARIARAMEPYVPTPEARFRAMEALHRAGVPVGVSLAPLVPGLGESSILPILERAKSAGAERAFLTLVRLPGPVAGFFEERLREALPERAERVLAGLREMRAGALGESRFHQRMRGEGVRWELARQTFEKTCKRLGLNPTEGVELDPRRGSGEAKQGLLF